MRNLALVLVVLLVIVLAGCGGSGKDPVNTNTGGVQGQVTGGNAASYALMVDGQRLALAPDAEGNFTIPNLPSGNHSLAVIGSGGYSGAHVGFVVEPGQTVDLGDILPQPAGQIVGLVSKSDGKGNFTPLEGVEVIADSQVIYYMNGQPDGTMPMPPRDPGTMQFKAITNADGSYTIPAVPTGSYTVTVNVPGLVQGMNWVYVSPGTTSPADFQLLEAIEPGVGTIFGQILGVDLSGNSAPLQGACVTINSDGTWTPTVPDKPFPLPVEALTKALVPKQADCVMPPIYEFRQFSTLTDANGKYSLNVPSGHLSFSVWAENYEGAWDSFALQPGESAEHSYSLKHWDNGELPPPEPRPMSAKK